MRNKEKEQRQKIMALYQQAAARGEMQFDFSQGGWGAHRQGPRFLTVAEGEALRKSSTLIPQQEAAEIAALKAEIERLKTRGAWLEIRKTQAKGGGLATRKTSRYSAYYVNDKGEVRLDGWETGGYGYDQPEYANSILEPYSYLLGLKIIEVES